MTETDLGAPSFHFGSRGCAELQRGTGVSEFYRRKSGQDDKANKEPLRGNTCNATKRPNGWPYLKPDARYRNTYLRYNACGPAHDLHL